ncbi:MAG: hypothetical protein ACYTBV_18810 [Planctomycetota bacterium]
MKRKIKKMEDKRFFPGIVFAIVLLQCCSVVNGSDQLLLNARNRIETSTPGEFQIVNQVLKWDPHKTAVIVCDMWNQHWCKGWRFR